MHAGLRNDHAETEWPASTVGPSCRANPRGGSDRFRQHRQGILGRGHIEACGLQPRNYSDQLDPSANSPCTSTTLRTFFGVAFAGIAASGDERGRCAGKKSSRKSRLFIIIIIFLHGKGRVGSFSLRGAGTEVWCRTPGCLI